MLNRLKKDLLDRGPDACLPAHLSDEWLSTLANSADAMLGNGSADEDATGAACMAVIFRLIDAKQSEKSKLMKVPLAQMREYFVRYRLELALGKH